MRRAAVGLLVLVSLLGAATDAALAAFPGANGRIAYARAGRGVWTVNADGTGATRLSPREGPGVGCDSEPTFSPSGLTLVFQTCDLDRHATAVGTMSVDGLQRRTVVRTSSKIPSPQTPTFAPDGKRLAFAAGATAATRLYSIRTDGRKRRKLDATGYSPSWSATAGLAFAVQLNGKRWCNSTELDDVYKLDPSLTRRSRLTKTYGSYAPDWSPNGRRIAYTRDFSVGSGDQKHVDRTPMDCKPVLSKASSYGPEIVVARANGKNAKRLTHQGGSDPSWSPDGALIAFERSGWIWTMRADGSGARRLVRGTQPTWQPVVPAP
jgi:Tol biopolymer transport system component